MSYIKEDYDLSLGSVLTEEVDSPDSVRISGLPSGCPSGQTTKLEVLVKGDNGDFYPLTDEAGKAITIRIRGNSAGGESLYGILASKLVVRIHPPSNASGLMSVDVKQS